MKKPKKLKATMWAVVNYGTIIDVYYHKHQAINSAMDMVEKFHTVKDAYSVVEVSVEEL